MYILFISQEIFKTDAKYIQSQVNKKNYILCHREGQSSKEPFVLGKY